MSFANHPLLAGDPMLALRQTLLDGLQSGRWRPGERLPTERDLCAQYGVGRSALRRVLREFKDSGLIQQTVGSGTYVSDNLQGKLPSGSSAPMAISPSELVEARLLIEPQLVDLLVSKATAADFEGLEECCRQAEAATTLAQFEHWDGMLHERIAKATHNAFFVNVFKLITDVRERGEWGELKRKSVTPEIRKQYEREHRELVAALKNRDAQTARQMLYQHLVNVRFNLLGRL
jgi:DNA-binding FadR family transcriptional regulator